MVRRHTACTENDVPLPEPFFPVPGNFDEKLALGRKEEGEDGSREPVHCAQKLPERWLS